MRRAFEPTARIRVCTVVKYISAFALVLALDIYVFVMKLKSDEVKSWEKKKPLTARQSRTNLDERHPKSVRASILFFHLYCHHPFQHPAHSSGTASVRS